MIDYRKIQESDIAKVTTFWNEAVLLDGFYKPFTQAQFKNHVMDHPEYQADLTYIALENQVVVGFAAGTIRQIEKNDSSKPGYLTTLLVHPLMRNRGIGSQLLEMVEIGLCQKGKSMIEWSYKSTMNWPWYIPETMQHDHPGAPGVSVNSGLYLFLLHRGYLITDHQDAFHLDLASYQLPSQVQTILEKNADQGYIIELYQPNVHFGLETFYQEINEEPFERVIRQNLLLVQPLPFLVISHQGQIKGWTGAMWTEPSGRAHFDGIVIAPSVRGFGLGKALFCLLGKYSKEQGAKFMTFFTGRDNPARYIYMGAGFKIIQSFAIMRKEVTLWEKQS